MWPCFWGPCLCRLGIGFGGFKSNAAAAANVEIVVCLVLLHVLLECEPTGVRKGHLLLHSICCHAFPCAASCLRCAGAGNKGAGCTYGMLRTRCNRFN